MICANGDGEFWHKHNLFCFSILLNFDFVPKFPVPIGKTVKVPILIFSGDEDPVGQNGKGVLRVYKMLKKDGTRNVYLRLFKNARHELLNEVNKLEVYNFILDWLDKL